jgi:hypothetical protein
MIPVTLADFRKGLPPPRRRNNLSRIASGGRLWVNVVHAREYPISEMRPFRLGPGPNRVGYHHWRERLRSKT